MPALGFCLRSHHTQCDLQVPICGNCTQGGRTCQGYARCLVSLNRTKQGIAKRKPFEEAVRPQYTVSWPISSTSSTDAPTAAQQKYGPSNQGAFADRTLLQPDNGVACEGQLIATFWDHFIPQQSVQTGCQCRWLQQALELSSPSPVLRLSLEALAMARIGWIHRDDTLVLNGRVLYSQALQAIQRALYDERTMWQDEILATGNILALYEVKSLTLTTCA